MALGALVGVVVALVVRRVLPDDRSSFYVVCLAIVGVLAVAYLASLLHVTRTERGRAMRRERIDRDGPA